MENPNEENFDDILNEIMGDTIDDALVGETVSKAQNNLPGLFQPRSVAQLKEALLQEDPEADIEHLTEFDVLIEDISGVHAARMNEILGNMTNNNFVQNYIKLLGYVKPKFKAIDPEFMEPKELTQINVNVINSKDELNGK